MMVAALYVETNGVYFGLPDVDPWDEQRDARLYAGPWPVVAHPPCARWGALAPFVELTHGYKVGEDDGCFEAALHAVRTFGGVLEHPANTRAFRRFGLPIPSVKSGWTTTLDDDGAVAYIEQGRYGDLPFVKGTWLYAVGCTLPGLRWGVTSHAKPSGTEGGSWLVHRPGRENVRRLAPEWRRHRHDGKRSRTPPAFRDVLLDMARSAAQIG